VKLSIIILTFNSENLLRRCLSSIQENTTLNNYEVIIIDNNSTDGTRQFLKSMENNSYRFILNAKNRGVGPARNQGLKITKSEYILILDVDTVVTSGAIDKLVDYLDQNPKCGLAAPKLIDVQGRLQFTCRKYPTIVSKFLRRVPFNWAQELLSEEEMHDWDHACIREVDYVIGACQLIRRSVVEEIGLLDEKIFYGPEDIDFCLRIWQAGYKVVFCPEAVIIHDEQRITRKKVFSRLSCKHAKGLAYFFWKHKYLFSRKFLYKTIKQ